MKKNLLFGFLILFVLSTTAFAGFSDPKKDSEKATRENKLSNEDLNRLTRRAETGNLGKTNFVNKEANSSAKNLRVTNQIIVESRHRGGYVYGGAGLLLLIILIVILV